MSHKASSDRSHKEKAMASKSKDDNKEIKWDVQNELALFTVMIGHKPVGINKHFRMAWIIEQFASALNRPVTSESVWKHLESMYDLGALDDMEVNGDFDETDFTLPSNYANLQSAKEVLAAEKKKKSAKETPKREMAKEPVKKETPKPVKEQPPKTPKPTKQAPPTPQPSHETPKTAKAKTSVATPKTRDSVKKVEPPKEKKEPRELKNLGTPEVKQQQSRSKETRSGIKAVKEESPIPTRRSLSTSMVSSSTKRPTRGSMAAGGDSKATSPAVSSTSSRSSTPQPTPKRRRI